MSEYTKPLPEIRPWTAPFWKGAQLGKLMLQRGKNTGKLIMYPKKYSPYDIWEQLEWIEASGKGTIYTFYVVEKNAPTAFSEDLPFCVAIVELEEGVRMCTNIVGCDMSPIRIGAPVHAVFTPVTDEITLVNFALDQ